MFYMLHTENDQANICEPRRKSAVGEGRALQLVHYRPAGTGVPHFLKCGLIQSVLGFRLIELIR